MHFAFRAVGLSEGGIGKPPFDLGEGYIKNLVKKGHQLRGLWPKTSGRMTLMRHFVWYISSMRRSKEDLLNLKYLWYSSKKITCKTFPFPCNVYRDLNVVLGCNLSQWLGLIVDCGHVAGS